MALIVQVAPSRANTTSSAPWELISRSPIRISALRHALGPDLQLDLGHDLRLDLGLDLR